MKNTPYNLRRFSETPVARSAINLVKTAVLSLPWKIDVTPEALEEAGGEATPDQREKCKVASRCFKFPNNADSWRTLSEAVLEDIIIGGFGCIEPRLTPDYRRPFKMWAVDGCYSNKVEVLTRRGWLAWPDVREDDWFFTRHPKTHHSEWQRATKLIKKHFCGKMIRFRNQEMDLCVTPNHEMLVQEVNKTWRKRGDPTYLVGQEQKIAALTVACAPQARDGQYRYRIPARSVWRGKEPASKKILHATWRTGPKRGTVHHIRYEVAWEDWVAFLGIYVAEGCTVGSLARLHKEKRHKSVPLHLQALSAAADTVIPRLGCGHSYGQVVISQSPRSPHYQDIKNLLARLPWQFHDTGHGFRIGDKALWSELRPLGNKYTKHVPDEIKDLPPRYLELFLDWAVKGDGSRSKKDGIRWYGTKSKRLADDMQELFQKVGSSVSLSSSAGHFIDGRKYGWGRFYSAPMYTLQERRNSFVSVGRYEDMDYDDYVYCAEVPNHTLYVRQHGYPVWCGNSTIRVYADWSESVPEKPHYAQLTGLKGERGIISFLDDELLYIRTNVRSSTPFGLGCLEVCFNSVNAFLGVQDMATRAASDNVHKTWLWWEAAVPAGHVETVRRHLRNEVEGQGQIGMIAGLKPPTVLDVQATNPQDMLLDWQQFLIRIIALGFNLSPLALGLERDVNRSTAQVMDESDFKRAVVPIAVAYAEHLNRGLLWGLMGWKDIEFKFVGLGDPSAAEQANLYQIQYKNNWIVPDEVRKDMGRAPFLGGWGKLTAGQMQILTMAARGAMMQRYQPGEAGAAEHPSAPPPQQQGIPLQEVGDMDPSDLEQLAEQGYMIVPPSGQPGMPSPSGQPSMASPPGQQPPGLNQPTQPGQPGQPNQQQGTMATSLLDDLTKQIETFLEDAQKDEKKKISKGKPHVQQLEKEVKSRFKQHEHELSREEVTARDIEKRRQYALTNRPAPPAKESQESFKLPKRKKGKNKPLGNQWTGRYPGGV